MAMVLDAFLTDLSQELIKMVRNEFAMFFGTTHEIEKLTDLVQNIRSVLMHTNMERVNTPAISTWLMNLKDIMYDGDDILDLCRIKSQETPPPSNSSNTLRCPRISMNPILCYKISKKIKSLNNRLEGLVQSMSMLGLIEQSLGVVTSRVDQLVDSGISRQTDPVVVHSEVVGEKIEKDANILVDILTKDQEMHIERNLDVVAVIGVGGIGKTTLAKKVYNHQRFDDEFQMKIWICVSKGLREIDILKSFIRQAGGDCEKAQEKSELVPKVASIVRRKKFFLVLDDVWRESQKVWDELLRNPLKSGALGSKVLVTTRDEGVARKMKAISLHRVEMLGDEDGWSLLVKQVVSDGKEGELDGLKDIGLKIVRKCDGLPLAIKTIGGVLCTKLKVRSAWEGVINNSSWSMTGLPEEIHKAFYLSYADLPPHLKQCFIYCSIYPEDWIFYYVELVHLWIAEGFLQMEGDASHLTEFGDECYRELIMRNLFEVDNDYYGQDLCKLHDLLRSFGQYLAKEESFVIDEGKRLSTRTSVTKLRRLSVFDEEVEINHLKIQRFLRTLIWFNCPKIEFVGVLNSLSYLRVLDLTDSKITTFPNSFCKLVHLRYLELCKSIISILPESLGDLTNLGYLGLSLCTNLKTLPKTIIKLHKLRTLSLIQTPVEGIPTGLRQLTNLVELVGFQSNTNSERKLSSLEELGPLSQLGLLNLKCLDKTTNSIVARNAELHKKSHLRKMRFEWTVREEDCENEAQKERVEEVFNELYPPPCLECFVIYGFSGTFLPIWMNISSSLQNLTYLKIEMCTFLETLPPLGQFPNLEYLHLKGANSIARIGFEFLGNNIMETGIAFPKLEKLVFQRMYNWREWKWEKELKAMPNLKKLDILNCPKLKSLPDGLLHQAISLQSMVIADAETLVEINNLPSLEKLQIIQNRNLKSVSNLPSLRYIGIRGCPELENLQFTNFVQNMELFDSETEIISNFLIGVKLENLTMWCNEKLLRRLCGKEFGSEWNKIKHIHEVKIYSEDRSQHVFYTKIPFCLTTNTKAG
ncbi:hypothetical protein LUZ60_005287 [Juncus effusus]|nr:hypothetical protein LUZ60_005287 [Juncus effusus]